MKILFDNSVPNQLKRYLPGHVVVYSRTLGWADISNGDLIRLAESQGFDVMVTGDQGIVYQQNNTIRRLSLVVLTGISRPRVLAVYEAIREAVESSVPAGFTTVNVPMPSRTPKADSTV